jgi:hypothetical protein
VLGAWSCFAASLALADAAAACLPDPCAGVASAFVGLALADEDAQVPVDGVLVLQANWFGELPAEALIAGLELEVVHEGSAVAGALAATELPGVVVWRPAAPLLPDATYRVSGRFTNPQGVPAECAAAEVELELEFLAAPGPAEPLTPPSLSAEVEYEEYPVDELDALVCCDGAYPEEHAVCGVDHGRVWSRGRCAPSRTRARLRVDLRAASAVGGATTRQTVRTLYEDGEEVGTRLGGRFIRVLRGPACFTVEQRSLATGEAVVSAPVCVSADGVSLGDRPVDPRDELAGACAGELYVCDIADGRRWDADACAAWRPPPDLDADAACGCVGADPGPGLLVLLLGPRRRRRS